LIEHVCCFGVLMVGTDTVQLQQAGVFRSVARALTDQHIRKNYWQVMLKV